VGYDEGGWKETYLGWTYHERSRILCRPSFSVTSAGDMANEGLAHDGTWTKQGTHTSWQILLVGKHQQKTVLHFTVAQYAVELLFCLVDTFAVLAVDNED
jgi:hypothetical protein